jgi:hypothetical protein
MATIGRRSAVVELARGARITGTLAWFAWLGLHLLYLLGNRNRVATMINLSWRYIAWGHGGGVIVGDEPTEPMPNDNVTGEAQAGEAQSGKAQSGETKSGEARATETSGDRAR